MNTVTASFVGGITAKTDFLWQWDYGQILIVSGLDLPSVFEVHFTNKMYGETVTVLGQEEQVSIPDELLQGGRDIYAYIYLHTGEDDGETEYKITIPVRSRPEPSDTEPTPVEQDIITQAIAALNNAVAQTSQDVIDADASALAAIDAKDDAVDAKNDAVSAKNDAVDAKNAAVAAQTTAERAGTKAEGFAVGQQDGVAVGTGSIYYHNNAKYYSEQAGNSASSASAEADRAEQASANAGYMFFWIDNNGHLIYERTPNTEVDFYLENGHLYVEASA